MWWGPDPSGRGVVDSKFSEVNPILSNFYARARVFWPLFVGTKSSNPLLHYIKSSPITQLGNKKGRPFAVCL